MKTRILFGFLITAFLLLGLQVTAWAEGTLQVEGGESGTDYTYESGLLTILTDTPLTISGSTITDSVIVEDGVNADITLSNLSILLTGDNVCAFWIAPFSSSSSVNITLIGTNILQSGNYHAGLVNEKFGDYTCTLTIGGSGSLTAYGGYGASGISDGSDILINGGTVTAVGGENGAGIGGYSTGDGGTISINGGTVIAIGGENGAGIGGGLEGSGGNVSISSNAVVYAKGDSANGAKDIGCGKDGSSDGTMTISDTAAVFLYSGNGPSGVTCDDGHALTDSFIYSSSLYGISLPTEWSGATGIKAYLRLMTLNYHANGGTGTVPSPQVQHIDTIGTVQAGSGLSRTGYSFDGWNTQSDGTGTDYDPDDSFAFSTNTTLYVNWTANDYTVTYDAENGTVPGEAASTDVTYDSTDTLLIPARAGYTFGGWYDGDDGTGNQITTAIGIPDGTVAGYITAGKWTLTENKTVHAKWTADSQELTVNLNGGNGSTVSGSHDTDSSVSIDAGTKTGYAFENWSTSDGGTFASGSSASTTFTMPPNDTTITANWTASDYTVTFDPEGGTVSPTTKNVTYDSTYGTLPTPTKSGFNFAGWWTGDNGTGTQITAANTVTTADNHTLYAKWTDKAVISITTTSQSYTYDGTIKAFIVAGISGYEGVSASDFTAAYNQNGDEGVVYVSPVNPGNYNVEITRDEDETYAEFGITIGSGLVINAATVDIAAISGITAPVRGAVPVSAITETEQYTGTVTWAPAVAGTFAASTEYTATITLTPKTGYTLTGVTADFFAVTVATSGNNDADSGVITAVFPATGAAPSGEDGGDDEDGGGENPAETPTATEITADVTEGGSSDSTLPVTVDKGNGAASVNIGSESLAQSGTIITIPAIPDVDTYVVGMPVPLLSTTGEQGSLTLNTDIGSVTVPSNMLTGVTGVIGSKAEIIISQGDKSTLPEDVKSAIGDKPLVSLSMSIDGRQTEWRNPDAPVTVSIPYTPTAAELANPESIVVWYIDGSGNVVTIPNGRYDAATGTVTFNTTHFSDYAVAYNPVSFNDVSVNAWYNKAVSFIAARDITNGTGNGNYSPESKLTRGEFIVLMMRAYGIAPDTNITDNFSDAGDTYYTGCLAAAKRLGITAGVGNNMYAPDNQITRQEMFTLLYNALKVIAQLPQGDSGKTVADFTDAGQISSWAQNAMMLFVKTGTVCGSDGMLNPTGTTTRAEMAQVLYNLMEK